MAVGLIGGNNGIRTGGELPEVRGSDLQRVSLLEHPAAANDLQLLLRTAAADYHDEQNERVDVLPTPTPLAEALPVLEPYTPSPTSIEGIICSFDWLQGCAYWIGVASCESSLYPSAVGYAGQYVGLFQVWLGHGYDLEWLLSPRNNTLAAWELSRGGTYTAPWPWCRWQ